MSDALFVGLDGGQSGTRVVVGDHGGRVLGRGESGPSNLSDPSGDGLRRAVDKALAQAVRGLQEPRFAAAFCGMSGGPDDKREILAELIPSERLYVGTDAEIALLGGTEGEPGTVVIAGTGSIAFARDASGRTARAGGWGYAFGDEGGAFDIARRALRASLASEEGWGPKSALTESLLSASGSAAANDLLHRFYREGIPREEIAALAPLVDEAASSGDLVADEILTQAAAELALIARAARNQFFAADDPSAVVCSGGVFHSSRLRAAFEERVSPWRLVDPARPPVEGALLGACRLVER